MTTATNYISNWQDVIDHMLKVYPEEGCGIVTDDNLFIAYDNIADDKLRSFSIDPMALVENKVKAIIHSHPYDPDKPPTEDPRIPSKADMQGQIDTAVEWGIVITEGENVTIPFWFGDRSHRPSLMDREFIHSSQDCLAFMTDWMYKEYNIDLPYYPRDFDWFLDYTRDDGTKHIPENLLEEQAQAWQAIDITSEPRKRGDVVFYKIRSPVVNHCGVMLDENTVAHHMFGRFPVQEPYAIWDKYVVKRYKLKELK
jgi:proteasome lid subunit RPN8/RPN11